MKTFYWNDLSIKDFSFFEKGSALTVGSFDGPHKGHESLFVSVFDFAKQNNLVSGIVTFSRALPGIKHSKDYAGDIASLSQRLFQYENKGFDFVVVIEFDQAFSHTSGEAFFKILIEKLNLKFLCEGIDFRCGYKGLCGIDEIRNFASVYGFAVRFLNLVLNSGRRVSSSEIRKLVQNGNICLVNELLERNFELELPSDSISSINNDDFDAENCMKIFRSHIPQVMPFSGIYNVLLNGYVPGQFLAQEDFVEIKWNSSKVKQIFSVQFLS